MLMYALSFLKFWNGLKFQIFFEASSVSYLEKYFIYTDIVFEVARKWLRARFNLYYPFFIQNSEAFASKVLENLRNISLV